jgi:hypothetical protein
MFPHHSHTESHPILALEVIGYSHSKSSSTRRFYSHMVLTLHVIWYSHSISSGTHNSSYPVPECSRNHPVPKCYRSSGTNINNHLVLDYSRKFGMFLEENRGHGFCPERLQHVDACVRIHPARICGPPDKGE